MVVLGIGVGLFYSSMTTVAITALDKSKASLAGAIIYMARSPAARSASGSTRRWW